MLPLPLSSSLKFLVVFALAMIGYNALAQPSGNPYRQRFPGAVGHWTDSLRWERSFVATDFGIWPNDGLADDTATRLAMDSLSRSGGGVLYFPGGTYDFLNDLLVPTGVVLRGDDPVGITDARQAGYQPSTRFEFPAYIFDPTYNNGRGYPNSSAFKRFRGANGRVRNAGLVNIDLNRAGISFGAEFGVPAGWPTNTPIALNRNIIIFGTRTNNVGGTTAAVPDTTFQHKWQRHQNVFTNNIGVFVGRNACVVNNRCNDIAGMGGQDDSFEQDGYIVKKWPFTGYDTLRNGKAWFRYTDHYGISVNRKSAPTSATPEQEPAMFADGLEIRDNWVYHTMRVAIYFTGINTVCTGNVVRDDPQKVAWIHTVGTEVPKNSNTLENRGIDVSGWGARVDSNDLAVYRHRINAGPFYSVDGEGILHQACCGGTTVNGYKIRDNVTHGSFISVFFSDDIHNVEVARNNLGGPLQQGQQTGAIIWINADVNSTQHGLLNNVLVEDNYGIDNNNGMGSIITGSKGGRNAIVRNNSARGLPSRPPGPDLRISCHVQEQNNQNFSNIIIANNAGLPCGPPALLPVVSFDYPSTDSTWCDSTNHTLNVKLRLRHADLNACLVDLYLGNVVIMPGLNMGADSTLTVSLDMAAVSGVVSITAIARQYGYTSFSKSVRLERNCPIRLAPLVSTPRQQASAVKLTVVPNPATGSNGLIEIRHPNHIPLGQLHYRIITAHGTKVDQGTLAADGFLQLPATPGLYFIQVGGNVVRVVR